MILPVLGALPMLSNLRSRSINAENPAGERGRAAMAASKLGPGRKGRPCIRLEQGETAVLMDVPGCGWIAHLWCTVDEESAEDRFIFRDLVLRMYWDGEDAPSVEVPLGDFFCCGFGRRALVNSLPICVNPARGMNCYFPMPFRSSARITLENQHSAAISGFFYQIDYTLCDALPDNAGLFHAQWRREAITTPGKDYTILDGVLGKGQYVGTYIALSTLERYWWGEGEIKFYYDGDQEYPSQCSTGMEDYFGGAWSFAAQEGGKTVEQTYCTPFMGYPFYSRDDSVHNPYYNQDLPPQRGFYRWHIPDPIYFEKELRVTCQQIGVSAERGLFERADDVSSVAYWYQSEPHARFAPLPSRWERIPR